MGKVERRREAIIGTLRRHGQVERKRLWTRLRISESRLCEDIKALETGGYQFDTSTPGFISLKGDYADSAAKVTIYEPITTPILRQWILITRISMCSDLRSDQYARRNESIGQTILYQSLCSFYDYIYEKDDEKKFKYTLNTFHRDTRGTIEASELNHHRKYTGSPFEEKYLFRSKYRPFLIAMTEDLAKKVLFVCNNTYQGDPVMLSFEKKLFAAYPELNEGKQITEPIYTDPKIRNVYERISVLAAALCVPSPSINISKLSRLTGLPENQVKKDLISLTQNKIGRRLFGKTGFRTAAYTNTISMMSNIADMYAGRNPRVLYLTWKEYWFFKEICLFSFVRDEPIDMDTIPHSEWHEKIEEMWETLHEDTWD